MSTAWGRTDLLFPTRRAPQLCTFDILHCLTFFLLMLSYFHAQLTVTLVTQSGEKTLRN